MFQDDAEKLENTILLRNKEIQSTEDEIAEAQADIDALKEKAGDDPELQAQLTSR